MRTEPPGPWGAPRGDPADDLVHARVRAESQRVPMKGVEIVSVGERGFAERLRKPAKPEMGLRKLGIDPESFAVRAGGARRVAEVPGDRPAVRCLPPGFCLRSRQSLLVQRNERGAVLQVGDD